MVSSSIFPVSIAVSTATDIAAGTELLTTDLTITDDLIRDGNGGILRVYMSVEVDSGVVGLKTGMGVYNNDVLKGFLNADNDSQLSSDGYYRFDIDAEVGDIINFKATEELDKINFMRIHYIAFGA